MKTNYNKTRWVDNKTPVNAENLNNIENGISNLYSNAISPSELIGGDGIRVSSLEDGISINLNFNMVDSRPESSTDSGNAGDIYIGDGFFYLCVSQDTWIKLAIENF